MARSKRNHTVPSLCARVRPSWFDNLSPRDLNHVLSLIDMGIDSTRTSRSEAMSCKSPVVDHDLLSWRGLFADPNIADRPSSSRSLPATSFSPQANSTCVREQHPTPALILKAKNVDGDQNGGQAPDDNDNIQILEDKAQIATTTMSDIDHGNGASRVSLAKGEHCKLMARRPVYKACPGR
jgi:hypothetical protein